MAPRRQLHPGKALNFVPEKLYNTCGWTTGFRNNENAPVWRVNLSAVTIVDVKLCPPLILNMGAHDNAIVVKHFEKSINLHSYALSFVTSGKYKLIYTELFL